MEAAGAHTLSPAVLGKALSLYLALGRWVDSAGGASGDREHGPTFAHWSSYRLCDRYVIPLGPGGDIAACWIYWPGCIFGDARARLSMLHIRGRHIRG